MKEAHCTESLQITLSYTSQGHDLRYMLMVYAICGDVQWTMETLGRRRAKDAFSAGMWARTSMKRLTSSRRAVTMAGEPERAFLAMTRSFVQTAR